MSISQQEKAILRELANKQLEIANSEKMKKIIEAWKAHGNFSKDSRPMVSIELWTFLGDIVPQLMKCTSDEGRSLEQMLLSNIVNHTLFDDDTVVRDFLPVSFESSFTPFGINIEVEHAIDETGDDLGHHFVSRITDLEDDFSVLKKSTMGFSKDSANKRIDYLNDIFGDILPAKLVGNSLCVCPNQNIVHIMSMEDMFTAMYDYPDKYHEMMNMLTNDYLEYFDMLERENLLLSTTSYEPLSQGTYCFNNTLPNDKTTYKTKDVFGYMDSQETSGVSPDMFKEFVFPYYKRISDRMGLLSYGCCEAVDPIWKDCISTLDNLRKVSISPWCNEEYMGEQLRGKDIVYLRKPSPNLIGVTSILDEDEVKAHFNKTITAAKGCSLEIVQRDVYHIHNTADKVKRYVELIRQCCEKW